MDSKSLFIKALVHPHGLMNICSNVGYTLIGTATLTCQSYAAFDQAPPTCQPNYCSDPTGVYPNVVITYQPQYHYQDTLNVQVSHT